MASRVVRLACPGRSPATWNEAIQFAGATGPCEMDVRSVLNGQQSLEIPWSRDDVKTEVTAGWQAVRGREKVKHVRILLDMLVSCEYCVLLLLLY